MKKEQKEREELTPEMMELASEIKFIDLKSDFGFKRVFGTPGNEEILLLLVNAILPELDVKSVSLCNQENMGDRKDDKRTVFDIRALTGDGQTVVIEMQYEDNRDFNDRLVYYSTFPIREQVFHGGRGYQLTPIYIVSIMDFCFHNGRTTDDVVNRFGIMNCNAQGKRLTENINFVTVELPKFRKELPELSGLTDQMIWLLRNMGEMKSVPADFFGKKFDKLFVISNFTAMEEFDQIEYLREFHKRLDREGAMRTAIEKGLNQGLQEGRQQGIQQGIQQAKLESATKFKAAGISSEIISQCTGLSIEEVERL